MIDKLNFNIKLNKDEYQVNYNLDKVNIFIGETGVGKTLFLNRIYEVYKPVNIRHFIEQPASIRSQIIDLINLFGNFNLEYYTDGITSKYSNGQWNLINMFTVCHTRSNLLLRDDIETGLDIFQQRKILPFIVEYYPNIQIITTTHSPFIFDNEFDKNTIGLNAIMTKL